MTPKRVIFPNPFFAWRYSAVIGRFHLKQGLCAFIAPKAAPSGKEWICIFILLISPGLHATSGRAIC